MPDKKDCCNKGAALEALGWVLTNKKAWAVLLMIAKLSPQAIVRAVAVLTCPTTNAPRWGVPCAECGKPVDKITSYAARHVALCSKCQARGAGLAWRCGGCRGLVSCAIDECGHCGGLKVDAI